ncbi:hypothetical protein B566_EDAN012436, partial [Ephemera danica]
MSSEIYWNKAKHPEHNVTLTVDMDKSNGVDFNATLLFPQQRIEMDGKWASIPRGYEAKGRLEWQQNRTIMVEAMFRGAPKEGILSYCEVVTKGVPVLGDSRRRVLAEFTSGSPATVRASYSWGADLEHNIECEASYRRQHFRTVVNLQATSTLWHGKEAKVILTSTNKSWATFSGEVSGKWGSEGVALHWEGGSTMRLGMQSSWSRLPSCGIELRTDERDETTPLVTKHALKVYYEDDRWEGVLSLRRQSLETQKLESVQLDVTTPLEEYRAHTLNVTWKGSYPRSMEVATRISTPLVGDYGFSGHWAMTSQLDAGLHIFNADITVLKLDMKLQRNAWQTNRALVTLLIPEVCNVETLLSFVRNSTAFDAQFQFINNKRLLHEFALDFHREHFDDSSVSVSVSFSGYSYVILTSKWDVKLAHAGTVNKHMSYIRINQFILDHQFDYTDYSEWKFYLIGKTATSDLLNITMLHEDGSRLFYYLNAMDKEVIHLRADMDQGYANLNLMDNAFQIHSKFTKDDELITYSKILSDLRIIAEVSTSSFLRYNEKNVLESMIISGNIKSDSDFATLKINMAAGRQIIGSLHVNYAQHEANIEVDLLSMNNSVTLHYGVAKEMIVELQGFLYFSGVGGNAGLVSRYREHNFWLKGDLTFNDDQSVSVKATADGSFDTNSFPMTLTAKVMIPQMRLDMTMLDRNQAGVSISTQLNLQPNIKSLMFKFNLPGYSDEFINFDVKYDTTRGKSLVFTYEERRFRYHGEFAMTDNLITAHLQTPIDGYRRVSLRLGVMNEVPLRAVLEFAKEEFMFDSEILFTDGDNSQVILIAKSSEGFQLESVFNKIRRDRFTDCLLVVDLNGDKMQAGALMEYTSGNLNITTNVTRGDQTARMSADIRRTEQTKSFAISSEYRGRTYRLHIYSAVQDSHSSYEQGFKVQTPSFSSEFKYEKSSHRSLAYLKFQNQVIHCTLEGTVKKGDLVISQTTEKSLSNLRLVFDFEDKIDTILTVMLNEQLRANIPVTIANANPLFVKALYNPKADNQKIMAIHFDYGADFYDIFSEVSIDGTYAVHINLDIKSSLPNFERITLLGGFKNDADFRASVKLDLQNNFYVVSINSVPGKSFKASLETSDKEIEFGYETIDDLHKILFSIDKREIVNAGFKLVDNTLYGNVITPYEKYRNVTLYVGYGENITRKSVEIHRNDELLFKAHLYPVDDLDMQSGTGIIATFYQGDEKLVYDAQFSINNPVYVILKQHETVNGTRDILHFNLNVTDEYTASVHRLDGGNKKELQVQYQNMDKRIFYLKALFNNEPTNKLVDLEARSPFLNGQVLVYSNGSVMGIKVEHNRVILIEIISKFQQLNHGHEYQFLFQKPEKRFELSTRFHKESKTDFRFTTAVDNKALMNIDFVMTTSGHIVSKVFCPNGKEYSMSGDLDWAENSLQLFITGVHSVTGAFQWGGVSDVIKAELMYKPSSKLLLNIDGPSTNYKIDYKTEWTNEKKALDLLLKRDETTVELNFQLAIRENLYMLVGFTKSPFIDFIRVSSILDTDSQELRGALQLNETVYSIQATHVDDRYVNYGSNFVSLILRNQSETFKGRVDYQLNSIYSLNSTLDYNDQNLVILSYFDPNDINAYLDITWPKNQKVKLAIILRPGELFLSIATPFVHFSNIQVSGKYSEYLSNNLYEISSSATAQYDEYTVSLEGSVRNLKENYGVTGTLKWGHEDSIILSCDVLQNRTLLFDLRTPFKGLPHINAKLEALKYRHMITVKQIRIDAITEKVNRRGYNTKIFVHMDQSVYEARSNYTINNGKLDTSVYLKGPNSQPIAFTFGGKFIMNSFSKLDIESYLNDDIVALKYDLSQNLIMTGKIYLPSTELWTSPTIFDLTIIRDSHFEGKLNYNHSGIVGNALVRNKLTDSALETIMYLNLPRILKYPLQLELNANYIRPRLQFSGYASFMAEHRLDLTMTQSSFRTTLDAHLNSAFFKGTKKFSLSLTSGTLSVSMNDEIRVTGVKKPNQLVLTLSQLLKQQDHTLTYSWELMRIPKFEVTLESPILAAKKATFLATYLGLTQGVNLKLVSGTETMQLDYGLVNQHNSKGIKVVVGNANTQILNFAATLVKIPHGHEIIADLHVLDLNYKGKFNYSLPMAKDNPLLTASLKLQTPYLLPMKILNADLKAGRENNIYVLAANVLFDEENIKIDSMLKSDSLIIQLNSTFDYIATSTLHANYKHINDMHVIDATLVANKMELISANSTLIRRPHSVILECYSKAKIEGFEEFRLKLTIPSELKYSLTANVELLTTEPFKAYFILTSRSEYTNLDLVMTGLSANIHLTSNQGDFSYKSGSDDYHMRIYSKSSGHELHSELTVNSGSIELFKAGLFGMYHNNTDFYILMSTTSVYEPVQNVVFYIGAEKSQLRFGAEYEGNMEPSKQSYTATINHHVVSLTDFDLGLTVENSGHETFTAKLTHTLKSDFYVALAQINKSIIKITKINQDQVILGTATAKPDVLYLAVDYDHSALIMIEFHPQKSRSKYVLLNFTNTKFMLDEYYENSKYELTASALIQESLYTGQYELTRDSAKPGSYKCNVTLTLPTRKVNLYRDQVKSANRNLSQVYLSWENLNKRVGYSYELYKDNFKTNVVASVEIPNRALQLKTHKKFATVDDMTEIEYGVQFNWNAKVHTTPVTMITAVKHNSHAGYVYIVFAHPAFNSSFVIDGEVRRLSSQETHFASKIGTVKNGVMSHLLSTALNITGDETTQQYRVQLLHSESGLDHVWTLKTDVARGFYAKLMLDDDANKKHATGVVNYIADYNHVDVSVSCQDVEMNLAGEIEFEGRYGVMLMGSYDPLNDPISISINFERTDSESSRLIAEISLAKDRSYNAE